MSVPTVTVIMPIYNAAAHVREATESILSQTFADFELLAVDDGSSDDSASLLRGYGDPRLRVERNERNLGLVATLNRAVGRAKGRYIARMDADDVSLPTRLAEQVAYLESHPDVSGVSAAYEFIDEEGRRLPVDYGLLRPVGPALLRWSLHFGTFFCHPASMLRREVFENTGGYDPDFAHAEDYELWLRATTRFRLDNLPRVLLRYRVHGENVSGTHRADQLRNAHRALSRSIAEQLGEEVLLAHAAILRDAIAPETFSEAVAAGGLLDRLCRNFVSDPQMARRDRSLVRADTATRLAALAIASGRRWPAAAARIAFTGCRLSPIAFGRGAVAFLRGGTDPWHRSPIFVAART
jgi:glycosyltransferase involved in cell wall biosynthesis